MNNHMLFQLAMETAFGQIKTHCGIMQSLSGKSAVIINECFKN